MHLRSTASRTGTLLALLLAPLPSAAAARAADVKTPAPALPAKHAPESAATAPAPRTPRTKPAGAPTPRVDPFQGGVLVETTDEGVHAAARAWKAHFDTQATTFTPFLGSRAPHNAPLSFRVARIDVGGVAIPAAAESVVHAGQRVTIERGAIDEAYALSAAGIEQLFTIDERVDAEVRVRIETGGAYAGEPDADGILFRSALGAVRYGRAFVVDADGARAELETTFDGATIEITVPAAFLAEAAYPVVVDPLITTFAVFDDTDDLIAPDVAYEDATGNYLHVAERVFSATDSDVYAWLGSDTGLYPDLFRIVDVSGVSWAGPRVAANLGSHNFVVVAAVGLAPNRDIRSRCFELTMTFTAPVVVSGGEAGDKLNPDVGGYGASLGFPTFLVAYQRVFSATDTDIHGRILDDFGQPVGSTLLIDNTSATLDRKPAVSKSVGVGLPSAHDWTVVWEREFSGVDHDVYGAQVHRDGSLTQTTFPIDTSTADDTNPEVSTMLDGASRPYMSVWERRNGPTDRDVVGRVMSGATTLSNSTNLSVMTGAAQWDQRAPSVDSDGHQFAVVYAEEFIGADYDLYADLVWFTSASIGLSTSRIVIDVSSQTEDTPAVTSRRSGGDTSTRFCAGYATESASWDTRAAIFDAPLGGPTGALCFGTDADCPCHFSGNGGGGCPNSLFLDGGLLTVAGAASVAQDSIVLGASRLPASTTCLFFQGTSTVNGGTGAAFGDGLRCAGGTTVRLATKTAVAGASQYPTGFDPLVSLRGGVGSDGGVRIYQVWYRNAATFCTMSTFNLTNAVRVVWTP